MTMHVVHDGPPDAPPLLLIHGSGASGGSWSPIVPALAERHHVIRVDLPGCGRSAPASSYDVPDQAARVARLLDGPVTVVGHSSGGYVATALAEQRPDLVRAIALISSGPGPEAFRPPSPLLRVMTGPPLGRLLWALRTDGMTRRAMSVAFTRPVEIPDSMVDEMRGTTFEAFHLISRRNMEYISARGIPSRLSALDAPVLVIFGDADRRWEPSSAYEYESVSRARVEILPGVGHTPMWEDSSTTAKLLLDFAA